MNRSSNKVKIEYEFATYKIKEGDCSQEDSAEPTKPTARSEDEKGNAEPTEPTACTEDEKEPPSKKGIAEKFFGKVGQVASNVKAAVGKTIRKVFSKTENRQLETKKTHSYQIRMSDKGIDKKGNMRQSLSTTYLIRHVDIDKCDSVSISVKPIKCKLAKAYLFVRFM